MPLLSTFRNHLNELFFVAKLERTANRLTSPLIEGAKRCQGKFDKHKDVIKVVKKKIEGKIGHK